MINLARGQPTLTLSVLILLLTQVACVQRNLEYNCQGIQETEMKMTPTRLQLNGVSYSFWEEAGAWRAYAEPSTGVQVRFNPSSGELILADQKWTCQKYGTMLEKARP